MITVGGSSSNGHTGSSSLYVHWGTNCSGTSLDQRREERALVDGVADESPPNDLKRTPMPTRLVDKEVCLSASLSACLCVCVCLCVCLSVCLSACLFTTQTASLFLLHAFWQIIVFRSRQEHLFLFP